MTSLEALARPDILREISVAADVDLRTVQRVLRGEGKWTRASARVAQECEWRSISIPPLGTRAIVVERLPCAGCASRDEVVAELRARIAAIESGTRRVEDDAQPCA